MHPWAIVKEVAFITFVVVLLALYACKITKLTSMIQARLMGYQWVLPYQQDYIQLEPLAGVSGPVEAGYSFASHLFGKCHAYTHFSDSISDETLDD